jgi:hypothetical protein
VDSRGEAHLVSCEWHIGARVSLGVDGSVPRVRAMRDGALRVSTRGVMVRSVCVRTHSRTLVSLPLTHARAGPVRHPVGGRQFSKARVHSLQALKFGHHAHQDLLASLVYGPQPI